MEEKRLRRYAETDKMSALISDNYSLLMVMSRFGISLGFGDHTVAEVCETQGVHCPTFLTVANFASEPKHQIGNYDDYSLSALLDYLKQAHAYFLDFNLPSIRRKLIETIDCSGTDEIASLILKFFDEYAREVRRHMEFENRSVFTYVEGLLAGNISDTYDIATFASKHSQVNTKLSELKNIIVKYYPGKKNNNTLNAVLFDIYNCEQDLAMHCDVEDYLLVPAVSALEQQLQKAPKLSTNTSSEEPKNNEPDALSQREKEIIACVVKGKTNKETADALCLSVHTVITHRRNIARKLQIHSPAGLTIYAIVNKLVELSDIKV
ncbi:MAG: helix-turn-helix transcriptional regulator [Bacteroidaceae bacterium]|nr:helix-turn-helix transcriptional regulator [Bacteroidaceae bacterium]